MTTLPEIARGAVECAVRRLDAPEPPPLGDELDRSAPCFVTVTSGPGRRLRGCVGSVVPQTPRLALEVQRNAVSAALADPRMPPVTERELPHLHYKVDVLGEMTEVHDRLELDPRRFGVLLRHPRAGALLLPGIDGIDSVDAQLAALLQKAGLHRWDASIRVWRFPVERHAEGGVTVPGTPTT